jgi:hypothetical protein
MPFLILIEPKIWSNQAIKSVGETFVHHLHNHNFSPKFQFEFESELDHSGKSGFCPENINFCLERYVLTKQFFRAYFLSCKKYMSNKAKNCEFKEIV